MRPFNQSKQLRHLYLIQAAGSLPKQYEFFRDTGRNFLLLSFKEETSDTAIFFPKSTWTTGRNRLREYIFANNLDETYDYFTFIDEDVSFLDMNDQEGFEQFELHIESYRPFIANPDLKGYYTHYGQLSCGVQSTIWFDGIMNSFSREAFRSPLIFPYCSTFDSVNWWMSQYIMIILCSLYFPHRVIVFNDLKIKNLLHSAYPRRKIKRLWKQVPIYLFQNLVQKSKLLNEAKNVQSYDGAVALLRSTLNRFHHVNVVEITKDKPELNAQIALPQATVVEANLLRDEVNIVASRFPGMWAWLWKLLVLKGYVGTFTLRKNVAALGATSLDAKLCQMRIALGDNASPIHIVALKDTWLNHAATLRGSGQSLFLRSLFVLLKSDEPLHEGSFASSFYDLGFTLLLQSSPENSQTWRLYYNHNFIRDFEGAWGTFHDRKDFIEIEKVEVKEEMNVLKKCS